MIFITGGTESVVYRNYLYYCYNFYENLKVNFFFFFAFLGPHPQHIEVSRLGIESGLQLPACTTSTATHDPSHSLQHTPQLTATLDP